MTRDKNFKDLVRTRASETGERYTAAREQMLEESGAEAEQARIVGLESRYTADFDAGAVHQPLYMAQKCS